MPLTPNDQAHVSQNEMFEEHLAEIALDWSREPSRTRPTAATWSPSNGFISVLTKSKAELIDLTGAGDDIAALSIDLANDPVVQPAA